MVKPPGTRISLLLNANRQLPIVHMAGDVVRETSATSHWWKNTGHNAVTLLSADVLHDEHDHNM
jgi:hypothetical protein